LANLPCRRLMTRSRCWLMGSTPCSSIKKKLQHWMRK
jgi:hypothetical protein